MNKGYTLRKFFNDIHLWLGLGSGLVLFLVCLSGTIITFHTEIEEMLEPAKYEVQVPANAVALAPDALIAKLQQQEKGKVSALLIPQHPTKPYRLTLKKEEGGKGKESARGQNPGGEKTQAGAPAAGAKADGPGKGKGAPAGGGGGRGTVYLVNQYTGEVKGTTEGTASEFFHTVELMHRSLLVESKPDTINFGKMVVGASTIIFVFIILTGLWIWFPKKLKNWKRGLQIKTSGNWKRINHDLHYSFGFYSSFLLLIMALTGLCWSFEWYRDGASAVIGDKIFKQRGEKPLLSTYSAAEPQSVASLLKVADGLLPYEGNYRVSLPADSTSAVVLNKSQSGFFALSASDKVQLDQYTGQPLKVEKFSDKKLNEKVAASVKGLHVGDVFGMFSKIIYFLVCLLATTLPITGTLMWYNKRKKRTAKESTAAARAVSRV
jgi:uncharacterized iron-regulated membrane protein